MRPTSPLTGAPMTLVTRVRDDTLDLMGRETLSGSSPAQASGSVEPVRMCVGCRTRSPRSDLVRLVTVGNRVVVDDARSMPGRGAWLHPGPDCLAQAVRRHSIGRALRSAGADASGLASAPALSAVPPPSM